MEKGSVTLHRLLRQSWQRLKQWGRWLLFGLVVVGLFIWLTWESNTFPNSWWWSGTGLGPYSAPKSPTHDFQGAKTLWDWMQLLVVPVVLAAAIFFLNRAESRRAQEIAQQNRYQDVETAERNREQDRRIAEDRQNEAALEAYLGQMASLLLDRGLRESEFDDEVRAVARAQTLTALRRLDGEHKAGIVQFLYESKLIGRGAVVVDLDNADLRGADLRGTILSGAHLSGALLSGADLSGTNLFGADLTRAYLHGTDLRETVLFEADLKGADFTKSDLKEALLTGADVDRTDFREADLTWAYLEKVDLSKAIIMTAKLREVDLRETDLRKGYLVGVDLGGADLSGVDLTGAVLDGANLTDALVTDEQLKSVTSLTGAYCRTEHLPKWPIPFSE